MKKFLLVCSFVGLLTALGSSSPLAALPGQIMIDIRHEYLPISPVPNGQGIMITGLASVDSLNVLYQVHTFEKVTDDSWSATKGFYLLRCSSSYLT